MGNHSLAALRFSVPLAFLAITSIGRTGEAAPAQRYINLTIPATEDATDANRPPLVLKASQKSVIVAQTSRAPGRDGDDIRVIEIEGERWRYVGRNGRGVTGLDGIRLRETARGPDGRLWVLAEHSLFPNVSMNRFCLFVLENDNWNPVGPRFGASAPRKDLWNGEEHGLQFLGDDRPVTVSIHTNVERVNWSWKMSLRRLEGDRWVTLPGHEYLYGSALYLQLLWRANDAWLVGVREEAGRTRLEARWIKGPRSEEVVGPYHLDSWAGKMLFFHFAVAPDGTIAAIGQKGDIKDIKPDTPFFVKLYHSAGGGAYRFEQPSLPPGFEGVYGGIGWGPTGVFHILRYSGETIVVHRFRDGHWTQVGEAREPRKFGSLILDPHLFFRDDSSPIVTWAYFTQVD